MPPRIKKKNPFFFHAENYWKWGKMFLLGANIHSDISKEGTEIYLCLYLGFFGLFFGIKTHGIDMQED